MVDILATSYLASTSSHTGLAAEAAAIRIKTKYAAITRTHIFVPVAVETLGPINADDLSFLEQIGDRLSSVTGEPHESSFLCQTLSVHLQRFNMIALRGSFISETDNEV